MTNSVSILMLRLAMSYLGGFIVLYVYLIGVSLPESINFYDLVGGAIVLAIGCVYSAPLLAIMCVILYFYHKNVLDNIFVF